MSLLFKLLIYGIGVFGYVFIKNKLSLLNNMRSKDIKLYIGIYMNRITYLLVETMNFLLFGKYLNIHM